MLSEQRHRWCLVLGEFALEFSQIEAVTYKCIRDFSADGIYEWAMKQSFKTRIDLLRPMLEKLAERHTEGRRFVDLLLGALRRAEILAERRNFVLHNPLQLDSYFDETTGNHALRESIKLAKKPGPSCTIDEVEQMARDAVALSDEMWAAYATLRHIQIGSFELRPLEDQPPAVRNAFLALLEMELVPNTEVGDKPSD